MKKLILGFWVFSVLLSCNQISFDTNLLGVVVDITDQSLKQNSHFIQEINTIKTKVMFLKMDPQSRKTAQKIEPIVYKIAEISDKIDDYILGEINALIDYSEGESDWLSKEKVTQITYYKAFEELKNKNNNSSATRMFTGNKGSVADNRGKAFVNELSKYRDQLILECFAEIKEKGKLYIINKDDLSSFDKLSEALENQNHSQKYEILDIYQLLTQSNLLAENGDSIHWNETKFRNQPLIGVIATLSSLRNDVRYAELKAMKNLMYRVDVPMMSINMVEAQVTPPKKLIRVGENINTKISIVAYDSTKRYIVKYRFGKTGDYIENKEGEVVLKTDSPGLKYIEGITFVEIAGELKEKHWSYEYIVNE